MDIPFYNSLLYSSDTWLLILSGTRLEATKPGNHSISSPHTALFKDMCRHAQIPPRVVGTQTQTSCLCSKCSDPLIYPLSLKKPCLYVATHKKDIVKQN